MPEPSKTGPEAIAYALSKLTVEDINSRGKALLATGKKSKRSQAVKLLNIARGMERNQLTPSDYLISAVPVIPTRHRPFAVQGDTMVPGDANVLYKDLIDIRDAHNEERAMFGDSHAGQSRLALYDAVKSVYGYGDAVKPKTRSKDIQGFLKKIVGKTSKFSFIQSKMLAKTQDNVGRSTIIADPDLSIDEIGIPKGMAFKMYAPYIQRRLKQRGYKDADALKAVRDQTPDAHRALEDVIQERPVLYSRAPAWYRFNIVAGKPKLTDNKALSVNPITIGAAGGDFDGDTINVHVPASDDAVKEAYEKLMPSSDPFSDRDQDKVVLLPKQEQILGLYTAATSDNQDTYDFDTEDEALKALKTGQVPLNANINIRQGVKMASAKENAEMKEAVEMHAKGAVRDPKTGKWMLTKNQKGDTTTLEQK